MGVCAQNGVPDRQDVQCTFLIAFLSAYQLRGFGDCRPICNPYFVVCFLVLPAVPKPTELWWGWGAGLARLKQLPFPPIDTFTEIGISDALIFFLKKYSGAGLKLYQTQNIGTALK